MQAVVDPRIGRVLAEPVKASTAPAVVHRLWVVRDRLPEEVLIAKRAGPNWEDDPGGGAREATFYARLTGAVGIRQPRVLYAGPEPDTEFHLSLLEDIDAGYCFPPDNHIWTQDELEFVLRTYARFHVVSRGALEGLADTRWLYPGYDQRLRQTAADLPALVAALVERDVWEPLVGLDRMLERTMAALEPLFERPSLLHNDVSPQNAGLPRSGLVGDGAMLIDWEMVGSGPPELDLAYPFVLPFGNTRAIDRTAALAAYWRERQHLEGDVPPDAERRERQWMADAVMALWLIPIAARRAAAPFPIGSPARAYWDAMFGVLQRRLRELCGGGA